MKPEHVALFYKVKSAMMHDLNDKLYKNACYVVTCSIHLYHMHV